MKTYRFSKVREIAVGESDIEEDGIEIWVKERGL